MAAAGLSTAILARWAVGLWVLAWGLVPVLALAPAQSLAQALAQSLASM